MNIEVSAKAGEGNTHIIALQIAHLFESMGITADIETQYPDSLQRTTLNQMWEEFDEMRDEQSTVTIKCIQLSREE